MIDTLEHPPLGFVYFYVKESSLRCGVLDSVKFNISGNFIEKEYYFIGADGVTDIYTDEIIYNSATTAATAALINISSGEYPPSDVIGVQIMLAPAVDMYQEVWFVPSDVKNIRNGYVIGAEVRITPEENIIKYTLTSGSDASFLYKNPKYVSTNIFDTLAYLESIIDVC